MAQPVSEQNKLNSFFKSRTAAGIYGGLLGAAAFGATLYTSPALIQAATYAIAGALAGVLGASVGVYVGAMVAVGLASTMLGAFLGFALRAAFDRPSAETQAAQADGEDLESPTHTTVVQL